MFDFSRNALLVYYKLYQGQVEIIDEHGNKTGSYSPQYGSLQSAYLSVSSNKGKSEEEMFGTIEGYDRTMTTSDVKCPIDENSILWLDGKDTDKPHNYIVTKRAPWKNSISFAIKKVDVGE